jgi:Domain of unknown function (DUF4190)
MTSDDFWGEKADADPVPTDSEQPAGAEPTGSGRPGWPLADPNGPASAGQSGWPQPTPPPPGGQPGWPQGGPGSQYSQGPQGGQGSPDGPGSQGGQGSQYGPGPGYGPGAGYPQYGQPGQPQPGQPPYGGQGPQYGQPQYGATQPGQLPQYADYAQPGQGQYGQNQYGQGQYGQYPPAGQYPQQAGPYGMQAAQMAGYGRRNPFAIAALVCGCVQILLFWTLILWPVLAIGAIACGLTAVRQIHQRRERGRGMAFAGIILGSVGMLLFLAVVGLVVGHHNG